MSQFRSSRRTFLKTSAAASILPYWFAPSSVSAFNYQSPSERPVVGCIGTGDRWNAVGPNALKFGDCVAVCDVDTRHAEKGRAKVQEIQTAKGKSGNPDVYGDYRKILDRKDIEVVTIVTPDHWHSKIAIEAMQAGKDVYCEKPLTLTIDEGKQIIKVLDETKRVFQVGTQQRSEMGSRFLQAIALIRAGRIGTVKSVHAVIGGAPGEGPFPVLTKPPKELDWDMWLGQAPAVPYIEKRCHYQFRWWYEYSGGKMTDWGAHHVDISQWAIGMDNSGPVSVEGVSVEHPVPLENGNPTITNMYNTATKFKIRCEFPNGVELMIMDNDEENQLDNGILFTGDKGRFFVSRSKIAGKPVEELESNPLPEDAIMQVYKGKTPGDHMGNFMDCVKTRELPISDVYTHHRAMTTCHLANIAIRLGRKIQWDPDKQEIVGDPDAQQWQSREQRKGYEIKV